MVHDTYFGETLSDPYRWMENARIRDWLPFLKGQNDHTRAMLDALPDARAAVSSAFEQLSGDTVATSRVQRAGGLIFFSQRPLGADNFKLFVRQASGPDRVLIDPTLCERRQATCRSTGGAPRPTAGYVVYGLSKNGSEDSDAACAAPSPTAGSLAEAIANTAGRQSPLAR